MNGKLSIASTAVMLSFSALALLMIASSVAAQTITVDGNGSDWIGLANVGCVVDDTDEIGTNQTPYFINGYDIADFCVHYDQFNDTLNFKINVTGVPGDADGDGNPNSTSDNNITDNYEVGDGETYRVRLDIDGDGKMEHKLEYSDNGLVMKNYVTGVINGTASGSIGSPPYSNTVVEMSFGPAHNMSGFGVCNNFSAQGWAGDEYDGLGEDETPVFLVNLAPVPLLVADHVCYCTNTTFDGSGSHDPDGTIVLYEWDFGDGNVSSGSTTSHHYAETGTYTVTLTVIDDYGFRCSNTTTVEVYENPSANFTSTKVCFCTNTTFNDTTVGGTKPYSYAWDFDMDGAVDSTEQNASYHYSSPGTHTATLNVTDANGCSNETTAAVYVVHIPIAVAEVNRSWVATPGGWVLFSATNSTYDANVTNVLSFNWTIHGATHTGENVTYNVTSNTTAVLNVTDAYGCMNSSSVNVTYRHRPIPVIDFTATGCLEVELNASNSSDYDGCITNYSWDLDNDGAYGDAFGITYTHNFGVGGNHTVGLNVTDNHNLTNTTTKVIYVSHEPTAVAEVNRSWVATPGGWVLFSATNSTYDANVTNSLDYNWTIHGATYTGENVTYNVTNMTTAFLTVTDEYGCMNSSSVNVTYRHRPVPVINFTATGCLEVELNASESYDLDGNITDYLWYAENGTIDCNTTVTCNATFSVGGNHTVRLNVTDDDGLTNTTTREIYVSCKPTASARANRTNVTAPGEMVLFDAPNSTCDTFANAANSLNYTWVIHGTTHNDSSGEGVEYLVTNTTTAFLTVTDAYNCTATDNVTVGYQYPPIVPVINFTATGCLEVELNASGSYDPDGNITDYLWYTENGTIDNNTSVTCNATFNIGGNHTVRLNVTDDDGLTNTTTKVIYVACEPVAVAEANRTSLEFPGGTVLFNGSNSTYDPDSGPLNYTWDIGGHTYDNVSVSYDVTNTTIASLKVTDRYNCTNTANVTVIVHPIGEPVPIVTPAGMLVLIVALSAVGMRRVARRRSKFESS